MLPGAIPSRGIPEYGLPERGWPVYGSAVVAADNYVVAFFTENGTPKTGLSPTVTIWQVYDATAVVTAAAMTEVAGGWYRYAFDLRDDTVDYVGQVDGGAGQPTAERYVAVNVPAVDAAISDVSTAISGLNDISVAEMFAGVVEGTVTFKQVMATMLAYIAASATGGNTVAPVITNLAGDVNRITYNNVDENGNRNACTLDFSDL